MWREGLYNPHWAGVINVKEVNSMGKRKAISKKMRFEVFKRDKFTCQYCGRSVPDVILHVDHIKPVSKGGTNDIMNLITSCQDCNLGKGARELSDDSVVKKQQQQLKLLAEKNEQLEMMLQWRDELQSYAEKEVDAVNQRIADISNWKANENGKKTIKKLIKKFTLQLVLDAVDTAFENYYDGTEESWNMAFNKIGGICYNGIREDSDQLYYLNYLNKACWNKFGYANKKTLNHFVYDYLQNESNFEEMKKILKNSRNWTAFRDEVEWRFW